MRSNVLATIQWPSSMTCHTGSTTEQELYSTAGKGGRDKRWKHNNSVLFHIVFVESLALYVLFFVFYLRNLICHPSNFSPCFLFPSLFPAVFILVHTGLYKHYTIIPTTDFMQRLKAKILA